MNRTLEGKVAIVTGGAAGIGAATARAFAEAGARVAIADVLVERGHALVKEIELDGGHAAFFATDVSREDDVARLVDETVKRFGQLDLAFNNAGIEGAMATTTECTVENFDRVLAVNLRGVFLCQRFEIAQMLKQGTGGAIVNMSSVAGQIGFPGLPAYVASKHAVLGLTKTTALEYATQGIRVNAVCPGVIHTEMIDRVTGKDPEVEAQFTAMEPMARMGTSDEVATAVLFLCSDDASFITGHALTIDGGFVAR